LKSLIKLGSTYYMKRTALSANCRPFFCCCLSLFALINHVSYVGKLKILHGD